MTNVEKLERQVAELSPEELARFREWFAEFDAAAWDRQLVEDVRSGALDSLADEAVADRQPAAGAKLRSCQN